MRLLFLLILFSCATPPKPVVCPDATVWVALSKDQLKRGKGNVLPFMTDATIKSETDEEGLTIWRLSNMPSDSIYYHLGLREGDGVYKTNLGEETNPMEFISQLASIPSGKVNCLYVRPKEGSSLVIKLMLPES